jgi:hypothetical protein
LNLKVHRAGGGSNKALGCRVDYLSAEILDRLFDGMGGHPIPFAEDGNFFTSKFHDVSSQSVLALKFIYFNPVVHITDSHFVCCHSRAHLTKMPFVLLWLSLQHHRHAIT